MNECRHCGGCDFQSRQESAAFQAAVVQRCDGFHLRLRRSGQLDRDRCGIGGLFDGTGSALIAGMSTIHPARGHSCAVALLVALALSLPVAASPADGATAAVPDISAIRIDNFGRVDSTLFRGAQPQGRDFADLKAIGVKTIVNLTSDDAIPNEEALAGAAGLTYVQIPMTTHTTPTAAQLEQFLGIVNDPARQPVYVHCVGGRHRTGVMTAAYRITHDGWTGDRAFKEMKQYKFGADFLHPEFRDFVYAYRPDVHAAPAAAATTQASVQR
jgi:protein tyrosine phosphatase (PTP) superfamily phosphohydrolase (DUF442 family)